MFKSDVRLRGSSRVELKRAFREIPGSICAPAGFKCASVFCDIKKLGTGRGSEKGRKDDLALIVSDVLAAVAGMFTTNQVCAAPVKISRKVAAKGSARAIVVNSGNANACTGKQGRRDAEKMAEMAALSVAALYERRKNSIRATVTDRRYKMKARDILVCSTGRIGVSLPMKNIERGIRGCAPLLARSTRNARKVAEAIMTTDTRRKEIAVEFTIGGRTVRIGGICKGAGMIQPGMATMLAFITTDAVISPLALRQCLAEAVGCSFNRITVDGDMSTNDSVIILANGLAGNRRLVTGQKRQSGSDSLVTFKAALNHVCLELARSIVRDGEGTSRVIRLTVRGARNERGAESAARAIANSSLVRASWCGGDPNWGRILCALGYSKAQVNESRVDVGYTPSGGGKIVFAFRRGHPTNVALKTLARITSAPEFDLYVDLHVGRAAFTMFAADLTEEYVALNKGDVNDPAAWGG